MFKTHRTYTVPPDVFLDKIFKQLPSNAFINKGRCGIGGTTLEINDSTRSSIIVAPTIGVLIDKRKSNPNLFIVYGEVDQFEVEARLALRLPGQKIMTTPEGMKKIIDAAAALRMADTLIYEWFLLLDESHTFISEDYRKGILRPFDYFWHFKNKAIISATPYIFSDPRFKTLDYHEIRFTEKLGTVNLVDCKSVFATLARILNGNHKGNLHIFLNSVTEIVKLINRAELTEGISIYCADDKDKENLRKLGELGRFFVEQPDTNNFSRINFYTSRYFEGWDMYDDNATIILVTDVYSPHTKVSVNMKLKQAAGRLRKKDPKIVHLTNHHYSLVMPPTIGELTKEYYAGATFRLRQYSEYLDHCTANGFKVKENPDIEKYADIAYKTKIATLNMLKLDQQINQAHSHAMYNHIGLIKLEWENAYFDVKLCRSEYISETKTTMTRKSKATQLEEDYLALLDLQENLVYQLGINPEDEIRRTNPLAYQAARLLDKETMVRLKYNVKKVQAEVIIASNATRMSKLYQLLANTFKPGIKYTNETIRTQLQEIYNTLELRDPKTGAIAKANANDLVKRGWFDIHPCKIGSDHGFEVIRARFAIRMAA